MLTRKDLPFPDEDSHLEYKSKFTKELKTEICAFLNNNLVNNIKCSYIYIGVNDNKKELTNPYTKHSRQKYEEMINGWAHNSFYPSDLAQMNIKIFPNNTPFCIKITSPRTAVFSTMVNKHPQVYIRTGSSKYKIGIGLWQRLLFKVDEKHLDLDEAKYQDLSFDDLKHAFTKHQKQLGKSTTDLNVNSLDSFHTANNKYTNTAMIFSDKNPFSIELGSYMNPKDTLNIQPKVFSGSILKQINDCTRYINSRYNDVEWNFSNTPQRKDIFSYPKIVLREVITNALAHRTYAQSTEFVTVDIHRDRIVIKSPGAIPDGHSKYYIEHHHSDAKNPQILSMLHMVGYAEHYGSGIPRSMDAYQGTGKQINIIPTREDVTVILPNIIYNNPKFNNHKEVSTFMNITSSTNSQPLTSKEKVIAYLKQYHRIDHSIVQKICGVKSSQATNITRALRQQHIIKLHGRYKKSYYTLIK